VAARVGWSVYLKSIVAMVRMGRLIFVKPARVGARAADVWLPGPYSERLIMINLGMNGLAHAGVT
jgi:hypothetical protein